MEEENDQFDVEPRLQLSNPDRGAETNIHSKEILNSNSLILTGDLQKDILRLMSLKGENYYFSFSGLRRSLGNIHQQQLTNTLDRLLDDSVLEKSQHGYTLTHLNSPGNFQTPREIWDEIWQGNPLQQQPIPVLKVFQDLYGKWYGKNRFLGGSYNKKNNSAILDWISKSNISEGQTRLELTSSNAKVKFEGNTLYDRDKALNVFIDSLTSFGIIPIFEKTQILPNN